MKKTISLLLALVLCLSLAACGGKKGPSEEQLTAITDAYNKAADLYKEVSSNAQDNGWMEDQETADAIKAIGDKLEPIGKALDGDISGLGKDADLDQLPEELRSYLPELESLEDKVSKRYVVIPEEMLDSYNELAELYQQAYDLMQTNGWAEDEGALFWLEQAKIYLDDMESGFPNNPERLEDPEKFDRSFRSACANTRDLIMMVNIPYDIANDGGVG